MENHTHAIKFGKPSKFRLGPSKNQGELWMSVITRGHGSSKSPNIQIPGTKRITFLAKKLSQKPMCFFFIHTQIVRDCAAMHTKSPFQGYPYYGEKKNIKIRLCLGQESANVQSMAHWDSLGPFWKASEKSGICSTFALAPPKILGAWVDIAIGIQEGTLHCAVSWLSCGFCSQSTRPTCWQVLLELGTPIWPPFHPFNTKKMPKNDIWMSAAGVILSRHCVMAVIFRASPLRFPSLKWPWK